jgi:hypothetical protein
LSRKARASQADTLACLRIADRVAAAVAMTRLASIEDLSSAAETSDRVFGGNG